MSATAGAILLAGRVLFAVFFVNSAYGHFKNHRMISGYAKQSGVPVPVVAGWPAGVWLAAASISVVAGVWADLGALMLAVFVIPTTWFLHAFWKIGDATRRQTEQQNFLRNITFLGAALALFALLATIDHGFRFAVTGSLVHLS